MIKLSVVILSYNTKDITKDCLEKLYKSLSNASFQSEIIIIDNASVDGSQEMISQSKKIFAKRNVTFKTIFNQQNEGYPKGNNRGFHNATGEYILFLNSDVMIDTFHWDKVLKYLDEQTNIGALTVRVELPTKRIDPASHRGFPTIWNSFCYYAYLEAMTKHIHFLRRYFGGYHLTNLNLNTVHEIDSPSGAFYLTRKKILNGLGGFDETFFMYGEDLDLSYRMKENGYKIVYYPHENVTHFKYQSGLKNTVAQKKTKQYFYDSMRIFYRKHYEGENPWLIDQVVYFFIGLKSQL
ncbi:MAG: Glycosyl transferase family 2 [Candidatus Roizmanbacteria bacterium GW2011_GWA2_37_7]|uniref:Glycosyl transferase family 2 n=1 Tax=Candidatus Roizmanbacteria bacterium GW2011_GWA2_37_7 TaxID=1618481 RepID=A0A0G0KCM4_9BACT|nr:MAG: Glycosyl transferase family 2 [Candidatus Roizmanbacteria bacterium GW2011_GWA2_37_7]